MTGISKSIFLPVALAVLFLSASVFSYEENFPDDPDSIVKISGEYRTNIGYQWADTDDFYWKYADTQTLGYNSKYLYGEKRFNTFNPNVYNSVGLAVDVEPGTHWGAHIDIVVDPWSFVGTTERLVIQGLWGARITPRLQYWSNTGRTRAMTLRADSGDIVQIPEINVTNGDTEPVVIRGTWGTIAGNNLYFIPATPIERDFRPVRNLWFELFDDDSKLKIFPFGEQWHALTSDDPLGLSNNYVYWEPSPWISYWTPGADYTAMPWESGYWTADPAEGRWGERLRLLRGVSFNGEFDGTTIRGMAASSISPWDNYETINNISFAGRVKTDLTDLLTVGSTYTGRTGLTGQKLGSFEQAYGLDCSLELLPELTFESEAAFSCSRLDIQSFHTREEVGEAAAGRLHYDNEFDIGRTDYKLAYTYMADDFSPPLATYANTREDQSWANHIEFKERSVEDEEIRIGDGVDRNRNVFSIQNETLLFDNRLEFFTGYRQAHTGQLGKFVEAVLRNEAAMRFCGSTTGKTLVLFHKNHPGDNGDREGSWVFGGGLNHKLGERITLEGIYEYANEYPYWPQAAADFLTINPDPPFPFFHMYKFKAAFEPFEGLIFEYNHCRNGFKFASGIWDNINYDGVEMRWRLSEKLSTQLTYKHSRAIDVNRLMERGVEDFRHHDNIYAEVDWEIWKDKFLKIQYSDLGEFVQRYAVDASSAAYRSSIQPDVLDTQDIVRVSYVSKF